MSSLRRRDQGRFVGVAVVVTGVLADMVDGWSEVSYNSGSGQKEYDVLDRMFAPRRTEGGTSATMGIDARRAESIAQ